MKKVIIFIMLFAGFANADEVSILEDEFKPYIEIVGISDYVFDELGSTKHQGYAIIHEDIKDIYFLRTFINKKNKDISHQIYVICRYIGNDWRHYYIGYFKGGELCDIVRIDTDVSCTLNYCYYQEDLGINISNKFLLNNQNGFSVKIVSKSGNDIIINVSKEQIESQLEAIKSLKNQKNNNQNKKDNFIE
jgi:hypothetical protein